MSKNTKGISIKEAIHKSLKDSGEITVDNAIEIIKKHMIIDPEKAIEQAYRRKAHYYLSTLRDDNGARTCFATSNKKGKYIDLDNCRKLSDIKDVEKQLKIKLEGLSHSFSKANRRRIEIEGQLSLFESEEKMA